MGVERGVWLVGGWLAHCWVLKHQGCVCSELVAVVWSPTGSGLWWWVVGGSVLVVSGGPSFVLRRRVLVWGVGGVVV